MKLSEAIRLGAMLKPQCHGTYYRVIDGVQKSCALGAAIDAGYIRFETMPPQDPGHDLQRPARCPACTRAPMPLFDTIAHLNDLHLWTREEIADWVETVEAATATQPIARAEGLVVV